MGSIILWSALFHITTFGVSFAADEGNSVEEDQTYEEEQENNEADYYDDYDEFYYESDPSQPSMEELLLGDMVTIDEQDIVTVNVLVNDRSVLGWDKSLAIHYVSKPPFGDVAVNHDNTITYN
ncbi:MAG: hypothetical protein ACREBU_25020, partial [Nitrososphaera sp.]